MTAVYVLTLAVALVLFFTFLDFHRKRKNPCRAEESSANEEPSSPKTPSRWRKDERQALITHYKLPPNASDEDISAASNASFEKMRRRQFGLPEDAPEKDVRAATAKHYGLKEDCTDEELHEAINRSFERMRRKQFGLPEDAPEKDVRAKTAKHYGLKEDCTDEELHEAINRSFERMHRRQLGLPEDPPK